MSHSKIKFLAVGIASVVILGSGLLFIWKQRSGLVVPLPILLNRNGGSSGNVRSGQNAQGESSTSVLPVSFTETTPSSSVSATPASGIAPASTPIVSADKRWLAFERGDIRNNAPADTTTTGDLEIVSADGQISKTFLPEQLGVSSTCDCAVSILGWGKGILWLENDPDEDEPINSFIAIDVPTWLVSSYKGQLSADSGQFGGSMNYDIGKFVWTDLPWGPLYNQSLDYSGHTYSVFVYDIRTGKSQTLETSTASLASPEQFTFGRDLKWINDNILQYYDFSLGRVVTTTIL